MQRKEAEKLLAALIFDDLDEASKKELLNYLQTDNELRERLTDMRMAVKVASDTVQHGPEPVLGKRRLKRLARLARHHHTWTTIFTVPRMAAAAAIFIVAALALISIQQFGGGGAFSVAEPKYELADVLERVEPGSAYEHGVRTVTPSDSESRRTPEITSTTGQYAFDPAVRGPDIVDMGYALDPAVRRPKVEEGITGMYDNALIQKQALEDMINYRRQIEVERKKSKEGIDVLRKTAEASIPYAGVLTYPDSWKDIIASPYRKSEEPLGQGQYAFDPAVRGPEVIDSITSVNNEKDFTKNKIGGGADAQLFSLHGIDDFRSYADSSFKAGPTDKLDSGSIVGGSPFESKPQSGVPIDVGDDSYDVGGYRPWWARDHGAGYGDKNGDGIMNYPYPATGYGGMGGFGAMGGDSGGVYGYSGPGGKAGSGEGGGGIMAPSPPGSRYGYTGVGGYAGGGYSNYYGRGGKFDFDNGRDSSTPGLKGGNGGDVLSGFMSGDRLNGVTNGDMIVGADTYNGNIDFRGKEINLFAKPDATGIVANGDSIAVDGRVTFQNGQAAVTSINGSAVNIIDNFEGVSNAIFPSTVTVDAGKPVTITAPELTLPTNRSFGLDADIITSTKPPLTPPLKPTGGGADITEMPALKLKTEGEESHLTAEDIKTNGWWAERRSDTYDEVFKKADDELGTKSFHYHSDRAKPPVPDYGWVLEGGREGDISKEANKAVIPKIPYTYSWMISSAESEKYIADLLRARDEFKVLTDEKRGTDEFRIPSEGPAGKEESGRGKVPILGDIPLIGGLYRTDGKKRPLTEEEKKRIVAYLEQRKSQPQGGPAELDYETVKLNYLDPRKVEDSIDDGFRDLPGTEFLPGVAIESLPQDKQIIIFGRKDHREAFKNMIHAMDVPPGESEVALGKIPTTGEDEPDLPPASRFKLVPVNPWVMAERDSLSTFALDVDTASYTLCRRYIRGGFLPPAGAVRMEEFINYFNYHYPQRTNPTFAVHAEAAPSPFARREQNLTLLKIGVKARTIGRDQRKAAHLIFVVDASASMDQPDRLPLVQRALGLLVNKLSAVDRVSLITCANEARLHLETVPASERDRIRQAINAIQPAGPTNLLAGLKLGYATARRTFAPKQINHIVLCSDGVANVGQTEAEAVLNEVDADRKQGITITCVGVGYGSYNDAFLEALANQGDGSYMFLDSLRQVHRVFVRQLAATLQTVAKDARIQVDFNPNRVRRYRLIGYENRDIEDERFRDDTIDAGEVGSGQCSTALYELELIGQPSADRQEDLGTVFVRYRDVETGQFEEISSRLSSAIVRRLTVDSAPRFFLAAGAARFAEILRQSEHAQDGNLMDVFRVVEQVSLALPLDRDVRELAELIRKSENLPRSP